MQRLEFESAWDKTIAPQDRKNIEAIFQDNWNNKEKGIEFIFMWEATNHKEELLVAVLIQNFNDDVLTIKDDMIQYRRDGQAIATDAFTLPVRISPKTTMPWTFIYSKPFQKEAVVQYEINGSNHIV